MGYDCYIYYFAYYSNEKGGKEMKIRQCDKCNNEIKGAFYKVCKSQMINKQQKLTHVGDLCEKCWKEIKK